jgi:hypothetical protein
LRLWTPKRRNPDRAAPITSASPRKWTKRLNEWQRLGVVISCVWILVSLYLDRQAYNRIYSADYDNAEGYCEIMNPSQIADCMWGDIVEFTPPSPFRIQFLTNAVLPIAVGWALSYFGIVVARWILAGRENSN